MVAPKARFQHECWFGSKANWSTRRFMARIALVVTNACAPDPRVERHARWLSEIGHDVEIHAWDRQHNHLACWFQLSNDQYQKCHENMANEKEIHLISIRY